MIPEISIDKFTYNLPDEQIARFPLAQRDLSKLLLYQGGQISEDTFSHLANYLEPDWMLVFNNTKVIHARLLFHKGTGARIEVFCLEPTNPTTFEQALVTRNSCEWLCTVGNLKKWKDDILELPVDGTILTAQKIEVINGSVKVRFTWEGFFTFGEVIERCGSVPIPPYLKRDSEGVDNERYQTVYSKHEGSVAAPTAGLHFTNEVLKNLRDKKITIEELTLHVGAGTFKPVKSEYIAQHEMHTEHFRVNIGVLRRIAVKAGGIIAVGTTSVRTLESLYWLGLKIKTSADRHIAQWEPYEKEETTPVIQALNNIIEYMESEGLTELDASTQIMIVPSYQFRLIRGLVTNFHQPQSTLLLLIAALIGNNWHKVYNYGLSHNFRFLSYGDSSLLLP